MNKRRKEVNRTIFVRDNLEITRGLPDNFVDLIYLDPPFNSKRQYSAPVGSEAAGAHFKDTWNLSDTDNSWHGELSEKHPSLYEIIHAMGIVAGKAEKAYLIYMAMRLLEFHRVLKDTGSIYLHCDQTMSHSLKLVMDSIFGRENFLNEIVWHYYNIACVSKKYFAKNNDIILWYSKQKGKQVFNIDEVRIPYSKNSNWVKNSKSYKGNYSPHKKGKKMSAVWDLPTINNMAKERTGYPTQKPLALLERIIKASCPPGGLVLDPFCGCATACIAAEKLGRQWIGIDLSPMSGKLIKNRFKTEIDGQRKLFYSKISIRKDLPNHRKAPKPPKNIKHILYGKQEGCCADPFKIHKNDSGHFQIINLEIDHIIPLARGGLDTEKNLQLLCSYCNRKKGDRIL